jgi:cell fate regulator YaaT (PSP1 superfamily)
MKKELPKEGQRVATAMGAATVVGNNPLKGTVLVELDSQVTVELPLSEISIEDKPSDSKGNSG